MASNMAVLRLDTLGPQFQERFSAGSSGPFGLVDQLAVPGFRGTTCGR